MLLTGLLICNTILLIAIAFMVWVIGDRLAQIIETNIDKGKFNE
jgi:hypothetical protein|tara:strand:+ start:118 stop:249 length:132 start_codon:yes stop_codon:yes gene_type:complete